MDAHYYNHGCRNDRKIALTFDDGPNPPRTNEVLEILRLRGVAASFFLIGRWVEQYPRSVERIFAEGHLIGNHGYSHLQGVCDFDRTEHLLADITGTKSAFIRAPHLNTETYLGLHPVLQRQFTCVHCDIFPQDYDTTDPREIINRIFELNKVQGGSIICLHDGSHNPDFTDRLTRPVAMIEALPVIIDELRSREFSIVRLDDLLFDSPIAVLDLPETT